MKEHFRTLRLFTVASIATILSASAAAEALEVTTKIDELGNLTIGFSDFAGSELRIPYTFGRDGDGHVRVRERGPGDPAPRRAGEGEGRSRAPFRVHREAEGPGGGPRHPRFPCSPRETRLPGQRRGEDVGGGVERHPGDPGPGPGPPGAIGRSPSAHVSRESRASESRVRPSRRRGSSRSSSRTSNHSRGISTTRSRPGARPGSSAPTGRGRCTAIRLCRSTRKTSSSRAARSRRVRRGSRAWPSSSPRAPRSFAPTGIRFTLASVRYKDVALTIDDDVQSYGDEATQTFLQQD